MGAGGGSRGAGTVDGGILPKVSASARFRAGHPLVYACARRDGVWHDPC
jgi:hypothetical protein